MAWMRLAPGRIPFAFGLDTGTHAGNHRRILAAQAAELASWSSGDAAAHIDDALHLRLQLLHIGTHSGLQHLLALPP